MGTGGAWDHSRIYTSEASEKNERKAKAFSRKHESSNTDSQPAGLFDKNQPTQTAIAHAAVKSIYSVDLEITPQICGAITPQLPRNYPANLRGESTHKISRGNCGIEHRFPWGFERPQGNRDLQRPRSSARRNRDQAVLRVAPGVCTSAARARAAAQQCTRATGSSPCSRNTSGSFTRCLTATAQSDRHTSSGCSITRVVS